VKTTIRIIFASALALSSIGPAFADEDTMAKHEASMTHMSAVHHDTSAQRARAQQAYEAKAYAPLGATAGEGVDFGIGSQR
jgi:hypothetical protein